MAEQSDVVDRANSLMRRRRSFVAARPSAPEAASATSSVPLPVIEDDDLPVLTEVVQTDAAEAREATNSAIEQAPGDRLDEAQVSLLASDIAHAIGQQLTCDLPSLLETALLSAGQELRAGITATMETALRDFIARRKQLQLPLDEPNADD